MGDTGVDQEALFATLRKACARVRVLDFFQSFDRHHLKRVTSSQAIRALEMAGVPLSAAQASCLASLYTDESGMWNYDAFISDTNNHKPNGHYEKTPDLAATSVRLGGTHGSGPAALPACSHIYSTCSDDEHAHVHELLADLKHDVAVRGLLFKSFMRDFDDHRRGIVTRTRFIREMSACFPKLSSGDVDCIARCYASEDGLDTRYMALHNDITPGEHDFNTGVRGVMGTSTGAALASTGAAPAHPKAISPSRVMEFKSIPSDDLDAVMASLIRQVFERRLRVLDAFVDFDPLKRGVCTRSQFTRGVASLALLGISPAAQEALADKYAVRAGEGHTHGDAVEVSYSKFNADVERAFSEQGLEKDPHKGLDSFARSVVTAPHPRFVRPTLPDDKMEVLTAALDRMKASIRTWRRYNIKAMLADYDVTCEGMVTETQFLRVLAMFDLVPQDAEARACVLDYFRGRGVKSHMIDYRAFLGQVFEEGMA